MGTYFPDWLKKMMGGILGIVALIIGLFLLFFILMALLKSCAEMGR